MKESASTLERHLRQKESPAPTTHNRPAFSPLGFDLSKLPPALKADGLPLKVEPTRATLTSIRLRICTQASMKCEGSGVCVYVGGELGNIPGIYSQSNQLECFFDGWRLTAYKYKLSQDGLLAYSIIRTELYMMFCINCPSPGS